MAARPRIKPTGARIGGLPAYTREQFKQVRPNGRYENYLKYIKRARGVTAGPAYPGRGGPGLPTYVSMLRQMQSGFETPAQLEARARRMAQQDYKFAQQAAQAAYKQQADDAMRRMLAFQSAGRAAAAMNASLIGQVGGQYQAGADALSQMASSGAAQMAAGTQGAIDAANAASSNVGMPGVTVGGPVGAPGLAGPTQAGVENYYSGTLGAQTLQNAGGYAQAGIAGQIGAQNLRATQEAQAAYMSAVQEANAARRAALQEALAGRKSGISDYLLKLQDAQRQQYALAMSLIEGRRNALQTGFGQSVTKKEQTRAQQAHAQAMKDAKLKRQQAIQAAAQQGREINEARSIALGYYVDNMGRPVLKNGKKITVPKSESQKAGGSIREKMATAADQWIYRHRNRQGGVMATKQQLYQYLLALYPGNPQIARAIADSTYPKGSGSTGGGSLGAQP